jgi:hypothetical protein
MYSLGHTEQHNLRVRDTYLVDIKIGGLAKAIVFETTFPRRDVTLAGIRARLVVR